MSEIRSKILVSGEDFVDLEKSEGLPYLKSVDLVKLNPKQFGLERWKPNIHLSDSWMRRIYANDYLDDECDPSIETLRQELDPYQKKVLFDHLTELYAQDRVFLNRKSRQLPPQRDCLREILDKSFGDDQVRNTRTQKNQDSTFQKPTRPVLDQIELCNQHRYHSEEEIVTIALDKMRNLSPEEEKTCQDLFHDREFMDLLNDHVERYLNESKD